MEKQTVRKFFGGDNYDEGQAVGFHLEPGSDGGICEIDNPEVLNHAMQILEENTL